MALRLTDDLDQKFDIRAYQCPAPKRTPHAGRTWDRTTVYLRDESGDAQALDAHWDKSWGTYWYFEFEGQWYRVSFIADRHHPTLAHRHGWDILYDDAYLRIVDRT